MSSIKAKAGTFRGMYRGIFGGGGIATTAVSPIWSDGFEAGDFTGYTEADLGSNLSVQAVVKKTGTYAAMLEFDATTAATATHTLPTDYTEGTFIMNFLTTVVEDVDNESNYHQFGRVLTSADVVLIGINAYSSASTPFDFTRINFQYLNDAGTQFAGYQTVAPAINTWYEIRIYWKKATAPGANDGILRAWFDGVQKYNLTTIDNDTVGSINKVSIGHTGTGWLTDTGAYIYWDDLSFYNSLVAP